MSVKAPRSTSGAMPQISGPPLVDILRKQTGCSSDLFASQPTTQTTGHLQKTPLLKGSSGPPNKSNSLNGGTLSGGGGSSSSFPDIATGMQGLGLSPRGTAGGIMMQQKNNYDNNNNNNQGGEQHHQQQLQVTYVKQQRPKFIEADAQIRRMEVGLNNLGNTCFMNSILQCLLHIQPLVAYFLDSDVDKDVNADSPLKGQLARSFADLCQQVFQAQPGQSISPTTLTKAVSFHAPHLLDYQQQDCQEFLRFLLDGLSEDLCRRSKKQIANSPANPAVSAPEVATAAVEPITVPLPPALAQEGVSSSSSSPSSLAEKEKASPSNKASKLRGAVAAAAVTACNNNEVDGDEGSNSRVIIQTTPPSASSSQKQHAATTSAGIDEEMDESEEDLSASFRSSAGGGGEGGGGGGGGVGVARHRSRRVLKTRSNSGGGNNVSTWSGNNSDEGAAGVSQSEEAGDRPEEDDMTNSAVGGGEGARGGETATNVSRKRAHEEAQESWKRYLNRNDSVVADIFAGQLQSTIECQTCKHRSWCFDPFLDLSIPIPGGGANARTNGSSSSSIPSSWGAKMNNMFSMSSDAATIGASSASSSGKCTLEECLAKFVAEEVLDGDNMYKCEKCKEQRKCIKKLSIYKYPKILVIHMKRFRYNVVSREKLSTDVSFPIHELNLTSYLSNDRIIPPVTASGGEGAGGEGRLPPPPIYDLTGVSNHSGSMNGGHYIAHVDTDNGRAGGGGGGAAGAAPKWMCFNDARVTTASTANISGPSAYLLFYKLRE